MSDNLQLRRSYRCVLMVTTPFESPWYQLCLSHLLSGPQCRSSVPIRVNPSQRVRVRANHGRTAMTSQYCIHSGRPLQPHLQCSTFSCNTTTTPYSCEDIECASDQLASHISVWIQPWPFASTDDLEPWRAAPHIRHRHFRVPLASSYRYPTQRYSSQLQCTSG